MYLTEIACVIYKGGAGMRYDPPYMFHDNVYNLSLTMMNLSLKMMHFVL